MDIGETKAIEYTFENESAVNKSVNWLSSDTRIATVDADGNVTALKNGRITITAIPYDGGEEDSLTVIIGDDIIGVNSVEITEILTEMSVGQVKEINAIVKPDNATNKNVKWYTTNDEVISIEQKGNACVLSAKAEGTAQINVVTDDGAYSASVVVTVTEKTISSGGASIPSYTVKFNTNGGSKVSNKTVTSGESISKPKDPVKDGYTFDGWYTDKDCTNKFNFNSSITKKITLYAKWIADEDAKIILTLGKKEAIVFGETLENDVEPKVVNQRTMLPIRFVAEALGAEVIWKETEPDKVIIKKDDIEIIITLGSDTALVNGKKVSLDSPAFAENSRTYLPLRFVAENLGANVEWVQETQQVIITK